MYSRQQLCFNWMLDMHLLQKIRSQLFSMLSHSDQHISTPKKKPSHVHAYSESVAFAHTINAQRVFVWAVASSYIRCDVYKFIRRVCRCALFLCTHCVLCDDVRLYIEKLYKYMWTISDANEPKCARAHWWWTVCARLARAHSTSEWKNALK